MTGSEVTWQGLRTSGVGNLTISNDRVAVS